MVCAPSPVSNVVSVARCLVCRILYVDVKEYDVGDVCIWWCRRTRVPATRREHRKEVCCARSPGGARSRRGSSSTRGASAAPATDARCVNGGVRGGTCTLACVCVRAYVRAYIRAYRAGLNRTRLTGERLLPANRYNDEPRRENSRRARRACGSPQSNYSPSAGLNSRSGSIWRRTQRARNHSCRSSRRSAADDDNVVVENVLRSRTRRAQKFTVSARTLT